MTPREEKHLTFLVNEWLRFEEQALKDEKWRQMAVTCYIAAHNYYVYLLVRK